MTWQQGIASAKGVQHNTTRKERRLTYESSQVSSSRLVGLIRYVLGMDRLFASLCPGTKKQMNKSK